MNKNDYSVIVIAACSFLMSFITFWLVNFGAKRMRERRKDRERLQAQLEKLFGPPDDFSQPKTPPWEKVS